jgi:long-chain fatty acid transport protein
MKVKTSKAKHLPDRRKAAGAQRVRGALGCLAGLTLLPLSAFGLGSRIPNQDAEAIGRGNAFAATADNPSAMYYNPAGITQLEGVHAQVGSLFYLNIYSDYDSPAGVRTENIHKVLAVPNFGLTYEIKDLPLTLGLGVYAPFGLGMEWPEEAPFRTSALEASLTYIKVNPVIAWKIFPELSIAAGPTFDYSEATIRQGLGAPPSPFEFGFRGQDFAVGFNAGIMWQPHPMWSFGARYMSATDMDYDGTARTAPVDLFPATQTKAHLKFPQIVSGGISFRPNTNWNFEVDIDWTDWHVTKDAVIDNFGTIVLNWESSFFYEAGMTYQFGRGYYGSLGYFFSEASTPEQNYTPLVPDTNLHVVSAGVGYKGEHWDFALAGQYIFGAFRHIENAVPDPTVNGSYRLWTPTISLSIGYHF